MSAQNIFHAPNSGRALSAATLSILSQAADSTPRPNPVNIVPASAELSPPMASMQESGDYFGRAWNSSTPLRNLESPGKSSSQYSSQASIHSIKPGAKNSFARVPQGTTESVNGSEALVETQRPTVPVMGRMELASASRVARDVALEREEGSAPSQAHGEKPRRKKTPSQKAMLSQALAKANQAVVLDNAQNFKGAMEAYNDACDLLQQVMLRSSGDEEKRKLDAIRNTYKNRIKELCTNELSTYYGNEKALPDVPVDAEMGSHEQILTTNEDNDESVPREAISRVNDSTSPSKENQYFLDSERLPPPRRQSLLPRIPGDDHQGPYGLRERPLDHQNSWKLDVQQRTKAAPLSANYSAPMDKIYMPPPLSPRRPLSPLTHEVTKPDGAALGSAPLASPSFTSHSRQATAESTSWLDTIDESGGSSSSSVHSRSSSIGLRRKHIRTGSGATEAEFDAALDAAVEAAYDDGYEPVPEDEEAPSYEPSSPAISSSYLASVRKNIDLAKQRVRDAEREAAIVTAREHEKRRRLEQSENDAKAQAWDLFVEDNEAEEEERMLEEMTREYILDNADYGVASHTIPPRKSDSSSLLGRTWGSPGVSVPTTAGTNLPTVVEYASPLETSSEARPGGPFLPPPSSTLPQPPPSPNNPSASIPSSDTKLTFVPLQSPGVRARRLSGQKVKQLKIDTNARPSLGTHQPKKEHKTVGSLDDLTKPLAGGPQSISLPLGSNDNLDNYDPRTTLRHDLIEGVDLRVQELLPVESVPTTNNVVTSHSQGDEISYSVSSPIRPPLKVSGMGALRKNYSSSSLKSLKQQVATPAGTDNSPGISFGRAFSTSSAGQRNESLPALPALPTPAATAFSKGSFLSGSLSFFDSDVNSPLIPGSSSRSVSNAPSPLEPCPESFLLRPFWLMRAIYQTIAHPRGGYISTRLFVPRDAWRVKNVKLKSVDDKVANCDLLTAALLNLQKVDNLDADAMLEEVQAFELILDQVQGQLGKKLGTEVGVSGSAAIFRASPVSDELGIGDGLSSRLGTSSKSYLSWKRLRSKHSHGLALTSVGVNNQGKESTKEGLTMRSLPMTAAGSPKILKRDPTKVLGIGPHSHYMAALGRLCDAVQILDQIARQVEDPGLRLSSQTHVGLELCIRHAAEFFAFFVCRFALTDIGMMLDKFIKRGSEWVMA